MQLMEYLQLHRLYLLPYMKQSQFWGTPGQEKPRKQQRTGGAPEIAAAPGRGDKRDAVVL